MDELVVVVELGVDDAGRPPRCRLLAHWSGSAQAPDEGRITNVDAGVLERRLPGLDDVLRSGRGVNVHYGRARITATTRSLMHIVFLGDLGLPHSVTDAGVRRRGRFKAAVEQPRPENLSGSLTATIAKLYRAE